MCPHLSSKTMRWCCSLGQQFAGNLARSSSLRRGGAPGGGVCLKPSTPSSSLARRFIHWLTAPSVTPRASSAISVCFQPRSVSSKARKRLPSRQSLAWLDNVFSIMASIVPTSLDFYAEISRRMDGIVLVHHVLHKHPTVATFFLPAVR